MTEAEQWPAMMARAQAGDQAAYLRLLSEIAPMLRRYVSKRLFVWADGEDVVQETLLSVHRVRHTYDPNRPFLPWLIAIARRRVVDANRQRAQASKFETAIEPLTELLADTTAERRSEGLTLARQVSAMLADLPPSQRKALELLKIRGLSLQEAAELSGISVGALKVAAHRAVRSMRALLPEFDPQARDSTVGGAPSI